MSSTGEILFFLCLKDRGGAEISMIKLAQGLVLSGKRVTMAVYGTMPALARDYGFTGEVVDFGDVRTWKTVFPLIKLLSRKYFSTVISALTHTNVAAVIAARLSFCGTKVVATEHGMDGIQACTKSIFFSLLTGMAYICTACVVTVSHALEREWRALLPDRVILGTIYNPVIETKSPESESPAHAWLTQKDIPVVMGIGRLKPEKNFSLLIRAFAKMAETREARLIVLGEGEQRPMLEKLIEKSGLQDKILLPGFVDNIDPWLAHASLLVCPSQREGFGNVVVEALGCGIPVIATNCPGPAEILEDGYYGRLVPVDDVDAMAQAIMLSLDDKLDDKFLRQRAADFTAPRCVEAYLGLIEGL